MLTNGVGLVYYVRMWPVGMFSTWPWSTQPREVLGMLRDPVTGALPYAARREIPFNVLLSQLDKEMLGALAAHLRVSQGQVIRQLVAYGYLMVCEAQPTCASGQACFMAHLHNRQGQVPHMSNAPGFGRTAVPGTEIGERRG